ncbi:hypothetical protein CsatB_026163 [Cannabis sativa]
MFLAKASPLLHTRLLQLSNMKPTSAEFKSLKLSSFKFDIDYNSYKSVHVQEKPSVVECDISVKLNGFSKKVDDLELKIDLLHTSLQKISSDLVELKEFFSAQFISFAAQMATMQTDKGSDSSNNDGGNDNEEDIDSKGNEEEDDIEEEDAEGVDLDEGSGDEEEEGSDREEKDEDDNEDFESKGKNDKGSDDECDDSEKKVDN